MVAIDAHQAPFRHGLYAVAWRATGTEREVMGHPLTGNVFFNAPYQIVSWDIDLDWEGYYAIFDTEFAREHLHIAVPSEEWPCFYQGISQPTTLPAQETPWFSLTFKRLHEETQGTGDQRSAVAGALLHAMLDVVMRYYEAPVEWSADNRKARMVNEIRTLALQRLVAGRGRLTPARVAAALNVSTGHLNAVVREVTGGRTTRELLNDEVIAEGQRLLRRTDLQIQEIADRLGYSAATHFNAAFKKATGQRASAYRVAQRTDLTKG